MQLGSFLSIREFYHIQFCFDTMTRNFIIECYQLPGTTVLCIYSEGSHIGAFESAILLEDHSNPLDALDLEDTAMLHE